MSLFPVGLVIAFSAFFVAIRHLNQSIGNYYDFVALFVVFGGTIGTMAILLPWDHRKDLLEGFKDLYRGQSLNYKTVLSDCLETLRDQKLVFNQRFESDLYAQILKDGIEMINLGLSKDKIEPILFERVNQYGKRKRKVANAVRSLAKYPPAFGLMGTVLGLVNVMRGVSAGLDGKQTALEMAIALVATMYGLIVANLFVSPAGELMLKKTVEQETFGQIAISTVCLLADQTSLLESQEILNSYAPVEQRVNVLDQFSGEMAS